MSKHQKKKHFSGGEIDTGLEDAIASGEMLYMGEGGFEQLSLYGGAPLDSPAAKKTGFGRCYESHPQLKLGGGTFIGGSCGSPVTEEADVYIGFERHMHVVQYDPSVRTVVHVSHPVLDMHAPANHKTFQDLVKYTASQLAQGKTVHAGCIGGHGRTGTFLAALVKEVMGEEDAITWVRKNYCQKAVESEAQVEFLHKYFGITKVQGHKTYSKGSKWTSSYLPTNYPKSGSKELPPPKKNTANSFVGATASFAPIISSKALLKANIL